MTQRADVVQAEELAAHPEWTRALAWFAGLFALLVALFHDVAGAMVYTWWTNVTYNHGFFVLPVSLWLIWLRRDMLRRMTPRQEPLALLALAAMAGGWLIGRAGDVLAVEEVALVGMLVALFVFVFGRAVSRRLVFPLAFLFFMVPVGDALIAPLQDFTARFAVELLRWSGIPVFHDGIMIQIPNGLYEVAEACAGIRFLIANVVISALFAHLAYREALEVLAVPGHRLHAADRRQRVPGLWHHPDRLLERREAGGRGRSPDLRLGLLLHRHDRAADDRQQLRRPPAGRFSGSARRRGMPPRAAGPGGRVPPSWRPWYWRRVPPMPGR